MPSTHTASEDEGGNEIIISEETQTIKAIKDEYDVDAIDAWESEIVRIETIAREATTASKQFKEFKELARRLLDEFHLALRREERHRQSFTKKYVYFAFAHSRVVDAMSCYVAAKSPRAHSLRSFIRLASILRRNDYLQAAKVDRAGLISTSTNWRDLHRARDEEIRSNVAVAVRIFPVTASPPVRPIAVFLPVRPDAAEISVTRVQSSAPKINFKAIVDKFKAEKAKRFNSVGYIGRLFYEAVIENNKREAMLAVLTHLPENLSREVFIGTLLLLISDIETERNWHGSKLRAAIIHELNKHSEFAGDKALKVERDNSVACSLEGSSYPEGSSCLTIAKEKLLELDALHGNKWIAKVAAEDLGQYTLSNA